MKNKLQSWKITILIAIVLALIPLITQGSLYFVGGDDMRLYYVYPKEYIQNLLLNIVTDNTIGGGNTGYYPATHPVPLISLIWLVKTIIPVNTQFVMYGLNWALAFIFLYKLLDLWLVSKSLTNHIIKILASLFYIFSPYLIANLYKHQLGVIYLIAAMPGMLYFFIKSVRSRNVLYVFSSCLVFTIFSTNLSSAPWVIPVFITISPILFWEFLKSKKTFILHGLIFGLSYCLLNISWIFHLIYITLNNTGLTSALDTYSSTEFLKANIAGILGTTTLFSPLNGVINRLEIGLINKINFLSYINLIFISLIVTAGTLIHREKNKKLTLAFVLILLGFLLSWYLMTPNFQPWGPKLFVWFSFNVPFFTMFRNMFDKFALPMAMFYALSLGVSLSILANQLTNKKLQIAIGLVLFIVIIINAFPLFKVRTEHVGVQAKMSGTFNDDFSNLSSYVSNLQNPSRILWLPMNFPTFVNIEDKFNPGHYYSGPSPLRFLSNRQDYTGQFSFITSTNIAIGETIFPNLKAKRYQEFGRMIQLLNARYVILDKQQLPIAMQSYLYGGEGNPIIDIQSPEFIDGLLGKKLEDFGSRYSIYEINQQYNNDRIYLTDDYNVFPLQLPNVQYKKESDSLYKFTLNGLKDAKKLVFLDAYYRDWTLYIHGPDQKPYRQGKNVPVQGFGNGWDIDVDEIKSTFPPTYYTTNADGSINLTGSLYFEPNKFNTPIRIISVTSFILLVLSQLVLFKKRNYA